MVERCIDLVCKPFGRVSKGALLAEVDLDQHDIAEIADDALRINTAAEVRHGHDKVLG